MSEVGMDQLGASASVVCTGDGVGVQCKSPILKLSDFTSHFNIDIDIESESQGLASGHNHIQASLESLGYTVTIIDL